MTMLSRREFLHICLSSAAVGLGGVLLPAVRRAWAEGARPRPPVVWLELGSCTGESVSLDNIVNPYLYQLLTEFLDLRYHWLYNTVQGDAAVRVLLDTVAEEAGNFWLVVEGSVMTAADGRYNHVFARGGEMVTGLAALREFDPMPATSSPSATAPLLAGRGPPIPTRVAAKAYGTSSPTGSSSTFPAVRPTPTGWQAPSATCCSTACPS